MRSFVHGEHGYRAKRGKQFITIPAPGKGGWRRRVPILGGDGNSPADQSIPDHPEESVDQGWRSEREVGTVG
jgi:hypothetical protein